VRGLAERLRYPWRGIEDLQQAAGGIQLRQSFRQFAFAARLRQQGGLLARRPGQQPGLFAFRFRQQFGLLTVGLRHQLGFGRIGFALALAGDSGGFGLRLDANRVRVLLRRGECRFRLNNGGLLAGFQEKRPGAGVINAGVYLFRTPVIGSFPDSSPLSFETDVFPALAALVGAWLGPVLRANDTVQLRLGLRVFAFVCGFLAVAFGVVVLRPESVHMSVEQAMALKLPVWAIAAVLLLGGLAAPWLAKTRGVHAGLLGMVATMAAFFVVLPFAAPDIQKPGTKSLAQIVVARAQPGDCVMHYHEFFHDFTFYAKRTVDVVAFEGELETEEDAAARASGRFMNEAKFRELWAQPGRIFVVARQRDVRELFADPTFHKHLLGETRDHYLFSNLP